MVLFRPFVEEDNATLLEIEKLCPQGNDKIAEAMDKSPDTIARYRLYDNWNVLVAEDEGKIAGWIGWTLKQNLDDSKYGYLTEVIVHPDFRRKRIATELIKRAEMNLKENGAAYTYGYIFEANDASNSMVAKNGYVKVGEMQMQAISVYKKANIFSGTSVRLAERGDIQNIVDLINNYNLGRKHFVPYTTESFETHINDIPGYGMDKLWVARSGDEILACAGLWDISTLAKVYYAKEPASMRFLGSVFNFLNRFTAMPKIPAENELFVNQFLTDYALTPEGDNAMSNLIKYLNNNIVDTESIAIVAFLTPDDPMVHVTEKFKPLAETWNIVAKSLDSQDLSLKPLYLDIRDFIM